ncbi:MAG: chemotaxis protein CheA, partial [Melioribacteraceae bacterium]|nr:chemotaxis protein CheA [Melioribacteraceae bacterium]
RLDELLNLVSELVLGRNRLAQLNTDVSILYEGTEIARNLGDTARQIDLLTTELQLAVMKTRMIKIGKVFNRFPRLVRDLSKETGKDINLVITGEKTELDKTLIEEINDPLVHLIRNSVDHGIEPPEKRIEAGKNPKGTITLSAEHEGNHIIISIIDDGKGIDPEVIVNKAISKGIITKEKSEELSKQEIFNLIFAPGFSTAEKVTNVSGRGVGMDVVKTNVSRLRGIIDVDSEVGKGTRIDIKLPLTLAIIQGLLVKVIGETIILPLSSVVEVVKVPKKEIYMVNKTECIKLRERVLPLINIDNLLYHSDIFKKETDRQFVVVIGLAEKRYGIKVDDLIGQKEIVIKSLGKYLGNIEGIAGSTIMGDGTVVMIADIAEIINKLVA